ncbi:hypothetical protein CAPTEDRAFT_210709 [Capitella teleta]|uniref:Uncharacterized protein n=1 Tax=Capitella teleta TaxID=283909 RepID=R7UGF5_CAPTE|nr:hypothetical protein CAPTEDRAFT_210709 [Capitella teleta]|eukprot:ELU02873.1 hypothetical protein CAPTEDRAFT_210709 [Capitella teleta]
MVKSKAAQHQLVSQADFITLFKEALNDDEVVNKLASKLGDTLGQVPNRRTTLRISGISETQEEDTDEVTLALQSDTMKIEPPITLDDIDRTHRIGPKTKSPRVLLVRFTTYRKRRAGYEKRSCLRGSSTYLNEDLTAHRAHLLYRTRDAKRKNTIKDCWTYDGITETWHVDLFERKGYHSVRSYRKARRGGGVSLFVKSAVNFNERSELCELNDPYECLFIELNDLTSKRNIIVSLIYRPPDFDKDAFITSLSQKLTKLKTENKRSEENSIKNTTLG